MLVQSNINASTMYAGKEKFHTTMYEIKYTDRYQDEDEEELTYNEVSDYPKPPDQVIASIFNQVEQQYQTTQQLGRLSLGQP